ncbi:2Fe-2S iron-sulfur cluster-binding protein [Beijerinckia mobilis]|uniref:2Fe-2S iron-sulfur cluster-binding protein n=1 Tax=Beijerinckia mobilis TaxID=231434 RepID=UPI0009FFA3B9
MSHFIIHVGEAEDSFPCKGEQTVLHALASIHHKQIRAGCHGGGCGVCRIRILKGDFVVGCMSRDHVNNEDEASGITLACRTWPRSHLVIQPMDKLPVRLTRRFSLLQIIPDDRVNSSRDEDVEAWRS